MPKGTRVDVNRGSRYAKQIAQADPTRFKTNADAPDAVRVYRQVLAARPDVADDPAGGVVVTTVGYLTNLRDLLASGPDDLGPLSGPDLIRAKVRLWVCMGGRYPEHRDPAVYGNFKPDPTAAVVAARDWPTPVVFCGLGEHVKTGGTLSETPENNPVRRAYQLYLGNTPARPSWDPIAVLYAVRPGLPVWQVREDGFNEIFPNGTNAGEPFNDPPPPVISLGAWHGSGRGAGRAQRLDDPPAGGPGRRGNRPPPRPPQTDRGPDGRRQEQIPQADRDRDAASSPDRVAWGLRAA